MVLPHFAQSHLLTLTPPLTLTLTPNLLTLSHWAKWDWAKWEDTRTIPTEFDGELGTWCCARNVLTIITARVTSQLAESKLAECLCKWTLSVRQSKD